jgi:hexosaminidase
MKSPRFGTLLGVSLGLVQALGAAPSIIPAPAEIRVDPGAPFVVTAATAIHADLAATPVANWLARWSGLQVATTGTGGITLAIEPALQGEVGEEGYRLTSAAGGVTIRGATAAGVFYGMQTLRQLLPPDMERGGVRAAGGRAEIAALEISDRPRFGWRGALLDSGRHFFRRLT